MTFKRTITPKIERRIKLLELQAKLFETKAIWKRTRIKQLTGVLPINTDERRAAIIEEMFRIARSVFRF